jgi:hypothetical protein
LRDLFALFCDDSADIGEYRHISQIIHNFIIHYSKSVQIFKDNFLSEMRIIP